MPHRPRKRFGQHFLHDPAVINKIISCIDPRIHERLIEIGPGLGAITLPLLKMVDELIAVEIDRDAAAALVKAAGPDSRLNVIVADALKTDFCALANRGDGSAPGLRIVGNLPYNISTPLLFHLLEQMTCIADMHFMLQREVVRRMAAQPGCKEYGRLTIMLALRCRVEALFDIGPGAFNPPPKVASSFVRLTPDDTLLRRLHAPAMYDQIIRAAFSGRRKMLRRSLAGLVTTGAFKAAQIDADLRPEQVSPADFVRLSNACLAGSAETL